MRLPVFKTMPFISPSTFQQWQQCQFRVYLRKLSGHPYIESVQGHPARVGIAFDSFVKNSIATKLKVTNPLCDLNISLKQIKDDQEAINKGRALAVAYKEIGWLERIASMPEVRVGIELYTNRGGIPLLGILDLSIANVPFDWKTKGFGASTASPTAGYQERVEYNTKTKLWHRVDWNRPTYPLESRNEDWAVQLVFYNWLLNNGFYGSYDNPEYKFIIHEITKQNDLFIFCEHTGIISNEFAESVAKRVREMWDQITDQMYYINIDEPMPSVQRCEKYKVICECAPLCVAYQRTLGDPERRVNFI